MGLPRVTIQEDTPCGFVVNIVGNRTVGQRIRSVEEEIMRGVDNGAGLGVVDTGINSVGDVVIQGSALERICMFNSNTVTEVPDMIEGATRRRLRHSTAKAIKHIYMISVCEIKDRWMPSIIRRDGNVGKSITSLGMLSATMGRWWKLFAVSILAR